jgi:hypothetical protein
VCGHGGDEAAFAPWVKKAPGHEEHVAKEEGQAQVQLQLVRMRVEKVHKRVQQHPKTTQNLYFQVFVCLFVIVFFLFFNIYSM